MCVCKLKKNRAWVSEICSVNKRGQMDWRPDIRGDAITPRPNFAGRWIIRPDKRSNNFAYWNVIEIKAYFVLHKCLSYKFCIYLDCVRRSASRMKRQRKVWQILFFDLHCFSSFSVSVFVNTLSKLLIDLYISSSKIIGNAGDGWTFRIKNISLKSS